MTPRHSAIALVLLTSAAWASAPEAHEAWTRAGLDRFPVAKADRTPERLAIRAKNLDLFAHEIAHVSASAPLPAKQWASLLGAIGSVESNYDTEVVAGRCAPWACDRGRARGAFQGHRLKFVADLWDRAHGDPVAQVQMADRVLRKTYASCRGAGVPFPASAFRGYANGMCGFAVHREAERIQAFNRMMGTPAVKP